MRERGGGVGVRRNVGGLSTGQSRVDVDTGLTEVDITQPEQKAKQSRPQTVTQPSDTCVVVMARWYVILAAGLGLVSCKSCVTKNTSHTGLKII